MISLKQRELDKVYLDMAEVWSKMSKCKRKQVGALIVKDRMIISDGYNGTPKDHNNCCEDENGETKNIVLHAEANAILKLAKSTQSSNGATLYVTLSPCYNCSKLILQAGIIRVVFKKEHSDDTGLQMLHEKGVKIYTLK